MKKTGSPVIGPRRFFYIIIISKEYTHPIRPNAGMKSARCFVKIYALVTRRIIGNQCCIKCVFTSICQTQVIPPAVQRITIYVIHKRIFIRIYSNPLK